MSSCLQLGYAIIHKFNTKQSTSDVKEIINNTGDGEGMVKLIHHSVEGGEFLGLQAVNLQTQRGI